MARLISRLTDLEYPATLAPLPWLSCIWGCVGCIACWIFGFHQVTAEVIFGLLMMVLIVDDIIDSNITEPMRLFKRSLCICGYIVWALWYEGAISVWNVYVFAAIIGSIQIGMSLIGLLAKNFLNHYDEDRPPRIYKVCNRFLDFAEKHLALAFMVTGLLIIGGIIWCCVLIIKSILLWLLDMITFGIVRYDPNPLPINTE